jgi:hypothetical protein
MEVLRRIGRRLAIVGAFSAIGLGVAQVANANSPAVSSQGVKVETGSVSVTNTTWECRGPVNLDSVTVTITNNISVGIALRDGCTGTIGSITVLTNFLDGVHIAAGAHDVAIGGGSVTCNGHLSSGHQDAIQVMSGSRITLSNLTINCPTANNAAFFVNWNGVPGTTKPTDVLCDRCYIFPTSNSSAFVTDSVIRSGLQNSTLCPSPYFTYRKGLIGKNDIDVNNTYPKAC